MRVEVTFYVDTPDGREYYDPDSASLITRLRGGGPTVQTVADLLDGSHKEDVGLYFFDTDGDYTDDTWYEDVVTWTYYGETYQVPRPFFYSSTFTPPVVPVSGSRVVRACISIMNRINAKVFTQVFVADRGYYLVRDIRELATLKVTVMPRQQTTTRLVRSMQSEEIIVHVAVQKRVATQAEIDALTYLVEEIRDWLSALHRYGNQDEFGLTAIDTDPVVAPAHIKPFNVFTSILEVSMILAIEN